MDAIDRRRMLQLLGAGPVAAGFAWNADEVRAASDLAQATRSGGAGFGTAATFTPKFFTASRVGDRAGAGRRHHPA